MSRFFRLFTFEVVAVWVLFGALAHGQDAELKVAGVFGDNMVLQRDQPIPVWGWAAAGQEVSVSLAGKTVRGQAGEDGQWNCMLDSLDAGGPYELVVEGQGKVSFSDVWVGEVWLCSGQSNMAMTVERAQDFEKEKTLADIPSIRMMTVKKRSSADVQRDCEGQWVVASPETVGKFSATAWFFGRKLQAELGVPVGLINSSWGGTDIAAWTSADVQRGDKALAPMMADFDKRAQSYDAEKAKAAFETALEQWKEKKASGKKPGRKPRLRKDPMVDQNRPSNLFNGMIHPVIPYGIRGAIWYQGERNSKTIRAGKLYALQLATMIKDWRGRWGVGDFPFITVQLPNFRKPTDQLVQDTGWVMVRESQLKSLSLKNTGIVVTTDIGMADDIHPKNKQAVGQRLALWALGTTYKKDIVYSGPLVSFFQYSLATEKRGGRCSMFVRHSGEGLKTSDGSKEMSGFAVAGEDRVFHPGKAFFNKKKRKLFVSSEHVEDPVAVRYNWAENPSGNVVNSAGLPMAPFRTDSWEIEDAKK